MFFEFNLWTFLTSLILFYAEGTKNNTKCQYDKV